jgi:predicted amidophosphoribosyltransferase
MALCPECMGEKSYLASRCPHCIQKIGYWRQLKTMLIYYSTIAIAIIAIVLLLKI